MHGRRTKFKSSWDLWPTNKKPGSQQYDGWDPSTPPHIEKVIDIGEEILKYEFHAKTLVKNSSGGAKFGGWVGGTLGSKGGIEAQIWGVGSTRVAS